MAVGFCDGLHNLREQSMNLKRVEKWRARREKCKAIKAGAIDGSAGVQQARASYWFVTTLLLPGFPEVR